MWYVYVIYSIKFDRIYVGMSENPERRLRDHNSLKVESTKAYTPWKIVMIEEVGDSTEARELEKYYKSAAGKRKIKLILQKSLGSLPD
ncbi:GIY-YIG nuclease family protein [Bacteroidota bacterium]